MKTKNQIFATLFLIVFSATGIASTPTLTFFSANDIRLEMPIKLEVATDSIPQEIQEAYEAEKKEERKIIIEKQFDIRGLSRPEAEVNDVSIDTRSIFLDILLEKYASRN